MRFFSNPYKEKHIFVCQLTSDNFLLFYNDKKVSATDSELYLDFLMRKLQYIKNLLRVRFINSKLI